MPSLFFGFRRLPAEPANPFCTITINGVPSAILVLLRGTFVQWLAVGISPNRIAVCVVLPNTSVECNSTRLQRREEEGGIERKKRCLMEDNELGISSRTAAANDTNDAPPVATRKTFWLGA